MTFPHFLLEFSRAALLFSESQQHLGADTRRLRTSIFPLLNMLSKLFRPGRLAAGASISSKPLSARSVGSLPPRQAQVSNVGKAINRASAPSFFNHLPRASSPTPTKNEEYKLPTPFRDGLRPESTVGANPVASAIPRNRDEFWRKVPVWQDVSAADFLSYRWSVSQLLNPNMSVDHGVTSAWLQVSNTVQGTTKLLRFLQAVVPDLVPLDKSRTQMQTREEFIKDVLDGVTAATMAIRMT